MLTWTPYTTLLFTILMVVGFGCASAPPPAPAQNGELHVKTDPSGALVFVDGKLLGRSPLKESLKPGSYVLVVNYGEAHYNPKMINIEPGKTLDENIVLFANKRGEGRQNRSGADLHRVTEFMKAQNKLLSHCINTQRDIKNKNLEITIDIYIEKKGAVSNAVLRYPHDAHPDFKRCAEEAIRALEFGDMDRKLVYPFTTMYSISK